MSYNNCIQYTHDKTPWNCRDINFEHFDDLNFDIDNFRKTIRDNFEQYKGSDLNYDLEEQLNEQKEYLLQPQQKFVPRFANFHNKPNVGNLLVYHELGSWKTCTSIIIGEAFKAFNKYNKDTAPINSIKKIIVATPKSIQSGYIEEIKSQCVSNNIKAFDNQDIDYNTTGNFFGGVDDDLRQSNVKQNKSRFIRNVSKKKEEQIQRRINRYWNITTHIKFLNALFDGTKGKNYYKLSSISKQL